jgi:hypothetical protein
MSQLGGPERIIVLEKSEYYRMRDDFPRATKARLAERVGFLCSNPECQQPTSGPQSDPTKAINVGVAAHITAASPTGPRYDPTLTPQKRCSIENGIWLCQTCGKLIDSDSPRYTATKLRQWKLQAEDNARRALERRSQSGAPTDIFAKLERQMPDLLSEMRADLQKYPLKREFVILRRFWTYNDRDEVLCYYLDDHPDLQGQLHILQNHGLIRNITSTNVDRYCMSEKLAEYLGA